MKFKKLLPIATISSVATIITPLATSCGGISASFSCNYDDEGHPLSYYQPKITKKAKGEPFITQDAVEKAYFDEVSQNNEILLDDLFFNMFGKHEDPENGYTITFPSKVSISISITKFDSINKKLSTKVKSKGVMIHQTWEGEKSHKLVETSTIDYDISLVYKNMPIKFTATDVGDLDKFTFSIDEVGYEFDPNWSVDAKGLLKIKQECATSGGDFNISFDVLIDKDYQSFSESTLIFQLWQFDSHYFSDQEYID